MTKKMTPQERQAARQAELMGHPVFAEVAEIGAAYFSAEVDCHDSLTALGQAVLNRDKVAYQAAFLALRLEGEKFHTPEYARTLIYRLMKNAGIVAPGQQGKRKVAKEPEVVDTSREAWLACYDTRDWTMARKIEARVRADEKA